MKDWLLIVLSVLLFGSPVSTTSLIGYGIAFAGVKYYNNQRVADIKSAAESKNQEGDSIQKGLLERTGSISSASSVTPRSTG